MGRPREHDDRTRAALVAAAERLVAEGGLGALSVRGVAAEVGATTRAVYSVFGSKDGLVAALAGEAFDYLGRRLDEWPETDDPTEDLIGVGSQMYREFVLEHPWLFRIAFQRISGLPLNEDLIARRARTWEKLEAKVARVPLTRRSPRAAAVEFNAVCEGLANAELRGGTLRAVPRGREGLVWREAFETLLAGLTA